MKFNLAQNVGVSQRLSSLGNELPQKGHTFSEGLIIRSALHLGHLADLFEFCFSMFVKTKLLYACDVFLDFSSIGAAWLSIGSVSVFRSNSISLRRLLSMSSTLLESLSLMRLSVSSKLFLMLRTTKEIAKQKPTRKMLISPKMIPNIKFRSTACSIFTRTLRLSILFEKGNVQKKYHNHATLFP